jgi:hypothetical protein
VLSLVSVVISGFALAQEARAADLFLLSVEVERAKAGGDSWDPFNGKPEPCVVVENENGRAVSPFGRNTFYMTFNDRVLRNVQVGEEMTILVWDVDKKDNDLIGATTIKITRRMIDEGRIDLCFDQVESLRLEIE